MLSILSLTLASGLNLGVGPVVGPFPRDPWQGHDCEAIGAWHEVQMYGSRELWAHYGVRSGGVPEEPYFLWAWCEGPSAGSGYFAKAIHSELGDSLDIRLDYLGVEQTAGRTLRYYYRYDVPDADVIRYGYVDYHWDGALPFDGNDWTGAHQEWDMLGAHTDWDGYDVIDFVNGALYADAVLVSQRIWD